MNEQVQDAIKVVTKWMHEQMYERHTEWTYGNEHDQMYDAYTFLAGLVEDEEPEEDWDDYDEMEDEENDG